MDLPPVLVVEADRAHARVILPQNAVLLALSPPLAPVVLGLVLLFCHQLRLDRQRRVHGRRMH
eukprot:170418-Rhodomonas_salina.4